MYYVCMCVCMYVLVYVCIIYIYIHTYIHIYICIYICTLNTHTYVWQRERHTHTIPDFSTLISCMLSVSCSQNLIVAFMMGTHARLNADSPLRLLDDHLVACIAQMAMADRWCVHACTFVLNSMHSNMYLCPDNGNTALVYLVLTCMLACIPDSDGWKQTRDSPHIHMYSCARR